MGKLNKRYPGKAVVVGAGPNGLSAAIRLAQAGWQVRILEARNTVGGGTRTAELTLPGYHHDICSAVHPLGVASPFLRTLPLAEHGLKWIYPATALAHPLDDGTAILLERSLLATGEQLGLDAAAYRRLLEPFVDGWEALLEDILGPLPLPPRHPVLLARFGMHALRSASGLARGLFSHERARALFAGLSGHSIQSLEQPATAAAGLMLAVLGHAVGWPIPQGGSQAIADAMASYFLSLGGEIITNCPVDSLDKLPADSIALFDVTPRQLLHITGDRLPAGYRRQLQQYRYGPGVFKVDFALDGPVPWMASECACAATVHLGGTLEEIALAERAVWRGEHPERPFVLLAQQSLFDASRAPEGKQTVWAYCHVPHGSTLDMTARIIKQIERFAPGFQDLILAKHTTNTEDLEAYNANYVGGDINGGVQDLRQLFTRPTLSLVPYATPAEGIYICSSSTPPGGGVHGMCGYHAATMVLNRYGSNKNGK